MRTNVQDDASPAVVGGAQAAAAMASASSGTELGTTNATTSVVVADGPSMVRQTFSENLGAAHLSSSVERSSVTYLGAGSQNPCQSGAVIHQPSFAITGKGMVANMGVTAAAFGVGSIHFPILEVAAITQNSEAAS